MGFQSNKTYHALIAGGDKGIGYAIAEALARRQFNLILIARHPDTLTTSKTKLEENYGVHVETLRHDLSEARSAPEIAAWCIARKIKLKVLCNVAGLGGAQDYLSLPLQQLRYMVDLNISSCVAMNLSLMPLLEENTPSYILNVSSMAGFAPIPAKNLYSATKSAVLFFSYSLRQQLKKKNISVSCLTPGPVFTKPGIEKETNEKLGWIGRQMAIPPEEVGEIAVRDTLNGKPLIIPGAMSTFMSVIIRILPTRLAAAIYSQIA
jgi:short-subunit dehydrogenase